MPLRAEFYFATHNGFLPSCSLNLMYVDFKIVKYIIIMLGRNDLATLAAYLGLISQLLYDTPLRSYINKKLTADVFNNQVNEKQIEIGYRHCPSVRYTNYS